MKNPASSSAIAAGSGVGSVASIPVSSTPQKFNLTESFPAPDGNCVPTQLKQIKTKVTERVKKTEGKPDTIIWDVRVGLALLNVYRTPHGSRELFTLSYSLDGKRYRQMFPTLEQAIAAAKAKGKQLAKGDIVAVNMSPADRASAAKVLSWVKARGLSLELVVSECLDAKDRLGSVTISRAVDSYLKRFPSNMPSKLVKEVADEMIQMKRADKLSERYIKQLEYDMKRFMDRFNNRLLDVSGTAVDAWLRELKVGPRTRNNLRNSVQALFNFGIARKYLQKDHDEIDAVPLAKDKGGEIEIFSPDEMAEVLAAASPGHLPFLAISAFAGVRHAEIQRLDWAQVNRKAKIIEIRAGAAKTASRRVIPILPNLAQWLKPHWRESGEVCSFTNMVLQFVELTRRVNEKRRAAWAKANRVSKKALKSADERAAALRIAEQKRAGKRARGTALPAGAETAAEEGWVPFTWKHNALRHSFISYRVSQSKNVAQVALEAGNSPGMIFKHYHELVQPAAAKKWFAIKPKG